MQTLIFGNLVIEATEQHLCSGQGGCSLATLVPCGQRGGYVAAAANSMAAATH